MRKFLLIAIAAFISLSCMAAFNTVTIHLKDGSKVDITMTEGLALTFEGDNLVATGSGADVAVEKNSIAKITHTNVAGVEGITAAGEFILEGDKLHFGNLPDGSNIAVYDLSGIAVRQAQASGSFTLPLQGLAKGVYIVSVNSSSYKISIK